MATFYGSDTACVTDVGLIDIQITSPALVIGQRLARMLGMQRGALALVSEPDGLNRGWDLRQYALGKLSPATAIIAQQQIQNECQKDEEVQSASVVIGAVSNGILPITISFVAASGPFVFTLNVSALTITAVFGQ